MLRLCPGLGTIEEAARAKHMLMLPFVNVNIIGEQDKYFSIYCDPNYVSVLNNNELTKDKSPRYSFLEYEHATRAHQLGPCIGIVVGIALYSLEKDDGSEETVLNFFMLRLRLTDVDKDRGVLPLPLYRCEKDATDRQQVQIDPIQHVHIKKPLFGITAVDQPLRCMNVNKIDGTSSRFYVLGEDVTNCTHRVPYDVYVDRLNYLSSHSNRRKNQQFNLYSQNVYMSFNELKKAKEVFGVKVKMSKKTHTKKNKSEDSNSDTEEELYEGVDSKKSDNILSTSKLGGNKLQKSTSRRGSNSSSSSRSSMKSGKKRNKVSSSDDENVSYMSTLLEDEDSNEM
jgi:hypothetical protein